MRVIELLDKSSVSYEVTEHLPAFTAQQMAAVEHESGKYVAKPVIVKADGEYLMCVLSASYKIDLGALKSQLGAKYEILPFRIRSGLKAHFAQNDKGGQFRMTKKMVFQAISSSIQARSSSRSSRVISPMWAILKVCSFSLP